MLYVNTLEKMAELTESGYRLYNDEALQKLQQILFFKELGFKLKEIKEILQKPDFDRIKIFQYCRIAWWRVSLSRIHHLWFFEQTFLKDKESCFCWNAIGQTGLYSFLAA